MIEAGDEKQKLQHALLSAFERTLDVSYLKAAEALGSVLPLMTGPSKVGRRPNVEQFRVIYMAMLIHREPKLKPAAAAKIAFPGDPKEVRDGAWIESKRKTLERTYKNVKDAESFKFLVALCLDLDAQSSGSNSDPLLPPLSGVLESIYKILGQNSSQN